MWVKRTDDAEHVEAIKVPGMDARREFSENGKAQVTEHDAEILCDELGIARRVDDGDGDDSTDTTTDDTTNTED